MSPGSFAEAAEHGELLVNATNTDSLGEQIRRAFSGVRVVKALNTMNAFMMADPSLVADGDHSVFVCGNNGRKRG